MIVPVFSALERMDADLTANRSALEPAAYRAVLRDVTAN